MSHICVFEEEEKYLLLRTHVWGERVGVAKKVLLRIHREGGSKIQIFLRTYLMVPNVHSLFRPFRDTLQMQVLVSKQIKSNNQLTSN